MVLCSAFAIDVRYCRSSYCCATQCPVLTLLMLPCYAMCGHGTDVAQATVLRVRYAMSATGTAYAPTHLLRDVWY
eukprot:3604468-Rhodomonas_salina.5